MQPQPQVQGLPPALVAEIASFVGTWPSKVTSWALQGHRDCNEMCQLQMSCVGVHDVCAQQVYDQKREFAEHWDIWDIRRLRHQCVYEDWRRTMQRMAFLPPVRRAAGF